MIKLHPQCFPSDYLFDQVHAVTLLVSAISVELSSGASVTDRENATQGVRSMPGNTTPLEPEVAGEKLV